MKTFKRIFAVSLLLAIALSATQPIQLTTILSETLTGISTQLAVSGQYVTQSGSRYTQGVMHVPTTAGGTAIPVSSLSNLGYAMFVNLDATNYVDIMSATSGTAFVRLQPGDSALFRFTSTITAPAMLAHTGACDVQFLIMEN